MNKIHKDTFKNEYKNWNADIEDVSMGDEETLILKLQSIIQPKYCKWIQNKKTKQWHLKITGRTLNVRALIFMMVLLFVMSFWGFMDFGLWISLTLTIILTFVIFVMVVFLVNPEEFSPTNDIFFLMVLIGRFISIRFLVKR